MKVCWGDARVRGGELCDSVRGEPNESIARCVGLFMQCMLFDLDSFESTDSIYADNMKRYIEESLDRLEGKATEADRGIKM